jgi:hypothetical protein
MVSYLEVVKKHRCTALIFEGTIVAAYVSPETSTCPQRTILKGGGPE